MTFPNATRSSSPTEEISQPTQSSSSEVESFPLTPPQSSRNLPSSRNSEKQADPALSSLSPCRKRKLPDSPAATPRVAKTRKLSDSTTNSAGSYQSPHSDKKPEVVSKKSRSPKSSKCPNAKRALWFKLDAGYWYMAWPQVGSDDAAAAGAVDAQFPAEHGKARNRTPVVLQDFGLETILNSSFFHLGFAGEEELSKAYAFVAPLIQEKSIWNQGIANFVFMACQLFLPRQLFEAQEIDDDGRTKTHTGPVYFYGAPLNRNYVIAAIISLSTGIYYTNKKVSSHMQQMGKKIERIVNNSTCAQERRLATEVLELYEHGSPVAREFMQPYINNIVSQRLKKGSTKGSTGKEKIPLSLHPMLAFFINRNGGPHHFDKAPVNQLVDVSDNTVHRLPYAFAWGWYFACRGEGVPEGVNKRRYPFGTADEQKPSCVYLSVDDIAKSGHPDELDEDIEGR